MLLHLLRHGQSQWNLDRRLQGQTLGVPLTALGLEQAHEAARQLRSRALTAVVTSDQQRAKDTAAIVAAQHRLSPIEQPRLREVDLGSLTGTHYDDLVEQETPTGVDVSEVRWGGGESTADVAERLRPLLADLARQYGKDDEVVLVSHGDLLRVLITLVEGKNHRDIDWERWAAWPNGHIESLCFEAVPTPGPGTKAC